mgnify:CR=1 FL=1
MINTIISGKEVIIEALLLIKRIYKTINKAERIKTVFLKTLIMDKECLIKFLKLILENVRYLGTILGKVIRDQEGEKFFKLVEKVRKLSKANKKNIKTGYSYKKIIPSLRENDNRFIATFDDDIIYPENSLEALILKSKKYPNDIIANRIHEIKLKNSLPDSYDKWEKNFLGENDLSFFTSGCGTLFPPKCFYKDIFDKKSFMELCPSADDIWLNWMAKLNDKKILEN